MWHWLSLRNRRISFSLGMVLSLSPLGSALAADTSLGPATPADAAILWKDSQSYYEGGQCEDALPRLKRLIDRHPGSPTAVEYRKARFELGHCLFELGRNKEAVQALRTYLEGTGDHPEADRAREMLGIAQLRLKRLHEAYLTADELKKSPSIESQSRALMLRTRVWIARKKLDQAKPSLVSALNLAEQTGSNPLIGETRVLALDLAIRECVAAASPKRLKEESLVRTEMEERGTCLAQSLVEFRKALQSESAPSSEAALTLATQAYRDYHQACENPPSPPRMKPKDRSATELKKYRSELADSLIGIFEKNRKTALRMISNWKQESPPPSSFVQERLQKLEESLK
jgi:tetratricopeptide (TPR) repeat protein